MKIMSHNFPYEAENGETDDTSEGWTMNTPLSQSLGGRPIALPQLRQSGNRSNPIAIVRNSPYSDSSDGELDGDDTSTIDLELDALNIATEKEERMLSSSLPSHLLRAPRLTALSDKQSENKPSIQYPTMLPPAMASAENPLGASGLSGVAFGTEDRTSYGSLRDSNSRGRFLDGPSSYRDKNTGDIRVLEHRVRFRDGQNMAQSLPASMSIGERIMQSRLKKKENTQSQDKPQPTSSLSALMDASIDDHKPSPVQQREGTMQQPKNRTVTFYDEEYSRSLPDNMLSTSLTALEVLQAGFGGKSAKHSSTDSDTCGSAQPDHSRAFEKLDELPRDAFGNNAILSRSLSDPTPEHLSSPALRARPSPNHHTHIPGSNGTIPPLHLATFQNSRPEAIYAPPVSHPLGPLPMQLPLSHDSNPDAECGFDLDME